jgi:hypothetical protein
MADMDTGCDQRSRDPEWVPFEGCAHVQQEVAQYLPYWGFFTGNNVIKRHP